MARSILRSVIAIAAYTLLVSIIPNEMAQPVIILVGGLILLLGFYSGTIFQFARRIYYYVFDVKGQINIIRISKYSIPHENQELSLSHSLFRQINRELEDITLTDQNSDSNYFRFKDPQVPEIIEVRLEPDPEFGDIGPDLLGYKLVVETYSDMLFGYQNFQAIERFERYSNIIETVIERELFPGNGPDNRFVIATIRGKIPVNTHDHVDEQYGMNITVTDEQTVELRMDETERFSKAIKKYFHPIKTFNV